MRRHVRRAARWRVLPYLLTVAVVLGFFPGVVRAQDGAAAIASAGEMVLLREQPGYDAAVLATLGDGSTLDITGAEVPAADGSSWLPVVAAGQSGYVPAGYVAMAATAPVEMAQDAVVDPAASAEWDPAAVAAPAPAVSYLPVGPAATTTETNVRAGPNVESDVLMVLPPGTAVSVDGEASNGFVPVTGWGVSGWVATELLTQESAPVKDAATDTLAAPVPAAPAETTELASNSSKKDRDDRGESTGIVWPMSGGEWEVVQGYNNGTHENRSGFAQYKYSLDWARVDGDTAGQPVFAPVSGTVDWVDRGSGGMLIDAGNGYGVAVFHVTLDRGYGSGDRVERGERIGSVSGPGGDGYMSMAHIDITCWRLTGNGHEAVPFTGPNAISGMESPDVGGANQHMGATVRP
jgi:uncharacterized protein YraI